MNARLLAKRTLGRAALLPPFSMRTRRSLAGRVNIVYYHYVGADNPWFHEFYGETTIERLDRDLTMLGRWFRFVPLERMLTETAAPGAKPPLAVTFDDGLALGEGLELLERHGVRATTFVITDCIGGANLMWRNKLSAIKALRPADAIVRGYTALGLGPLESGGALMRASGTWPMRRKDELADDLWRACEMPPLAEFLADQRPYLGWEDLREWQRRGHGVGLHTKTHPYCARLDGDEVEEEVVRPATLLRDQLGLDWLPLSYPFGSRLPAAVEEDLFERRVFDCALGIAGFAPVGTAPHRLERASGEHLLDYHVFGRAFAGRPR